MLPAASASGLLADEGFRERLRQCGANPENAVAYKGRIRQVLDAKAAGARRRGMTVDFVQAYQHGKLARFILVHDPSLPGQLQKQAVAVSGTDSWDEALAKAGIVMAERRRVSPPKAYVECPECGRYGSSTLCAVCHGKGLIPSSDGS